MFSRFLPKNANAGRYLALPCEQRRQLDAGVEAGHAVLQPTHGHPQPGRRHGEATQPSGLQAYGAAGLGEDPGPDRHDRWHREHRHGQLVLSHLLFRFARCGSASFRGAAAAAASRKRDGDGRDTQKNRGQGVAGRKGEGRRGGVRGAAASWGRRMEAIRDTTSQTPSFA